MVKVYDEVEGMEKVDGPGLKADLCLNGITKKLLMIKTPKTKTKMK